MRTTRQPGRIGRAVTLAFSSLLALALPAQAVEQTVTFATTNFASLPNPFPTTFDQDGFRFTISGGGNPTFQTWFDVPTGQPAPNPLSGQFILNRDSGGGIGQTVTITRADGSAFNFVRIGVANYNPSTGVSVQVRNGASTVITDSVAGYTLKNVVTPGGTPVVATSIVISGSSSSATTGNFPNSTTQSFGIVTGFDNLVYDVPSAGPTITNLQSNSVNYNEGGAAVLLDTSSNATVADTDSANFAGGQLRVNVNVNPWPAEDVLEVLNAGTVTTSGASVLVGGTEIGLISSDGRDGRPLVIDLDADATPATTASLVRAIAYSNRLAAGIDLNQRGIRWVLSDGDGGTSPSYDTTVNPRPPALPGAGVVNFNTGTTTPDISATAPSQFDSSGYRFIATAAAGSNPVMQQNFDTPNSPGVSFGSNGVSANTNVTIARTTGAQFGFEQIVVRNSDENTNLTVEARQQPGNVLVTQTIPPQGMRRLVFGGITVDQVRLLGQSNASLLRAGLFDDFVFSVTNLPPSVSLLNGDTVTYTQGNAGITTLDLGGNATVADSDSADFNGGDVTVTITGNLWGAQDVLTVADVGPIVRAGNNVQHGGTTIGTIAASGAGSGTAGNALVVALNAQATPARVQDLVRALGYRNSNTTNPDLGNRTVTIGVDDGDGAPAVTNTVTVRVFPDALPAGVVTDVNFSGLGTLPPNTTTTDFQSYRFTLTGGFQRFLQNSSLAVSGTALVAADTGISSQTLTAARIDGATFRGQSMIIANRDPNAAKTIRTFNGAAAGETLTLPARATQRVVFNGNPITRIEISGSTGSDFAQLAIIDELSVIPPNVPPVVTTSGGTTAYTENGIPLAVDGAIGVSDANDNWNSGSLRAQITANASADDRLRVAALGTVTLAGNTVSVGGTAMGTVGTNPVTAGNLLTVTLNAAATNAGVQAIARAIAFDNVSETPTTATRTVTFSALDAATAASGNATRAVSVTAVNDAPTVTTNAGLTVAEAATATIGTARLSAADADGDALTYTITTPPTRGRVALAAAPGTAITSFTQAQLAANAVVYVHDGSETTSDSFTFNLRDPSNAGPSGVVFAITITPVNDAPVVTAGQTFTVDENSAAGTVVGTAAATDVDNPPTALQAWTITTNADPDGDTTPAFAISAATGAITVADAGDLDRETSASLVIAVRVSDGTDNSLPANVTINLGDRNDVVPSVNAGQTYTLAENSAAATVLGTLAASDGDVSPTTFSAWTITAGNIGNAFALNPATGQLSVATAAALDFETNPTFNLSVTVSDGTNTSAPRTVAVNLTNVNEAPTVTAATFSLAENSAAATVVGTVVASDTDAGQTRSFAITAGNTAGAFAINPTSGAVTVANAAAIDFETNPVFTLTVTATDNGSPPLAGSATVTVNLADRNDTPVFNDGSFAIAENSANGTVVGTLAVSDQDAGQTLAIAITGGNTNGAFAVDQATRRLVVANVAALDFETNPVFTLAMSATDNGSPPASDTATVVVNLSNVNDAPTVTTNAGLTVAEAATATIGTARLSAADADGDALTYTITTPPTRGRVALAAAPGTAITSFTQAQLAANAVVYVHDGSETTSDGFTFNLRDPSNAGPSGVVFAITVTPVNDPPVVTAGQTFTVDENSAASTVVGTAAATDVDNPPTALQAWTITTNADPDGDSTPAFAISAATGAITVADAGDLDRETSASLVIAVRVSDGTDNSLPANVTINLGDRNDVVPSVNAGQTYTLAENSAAATVLGTLAASDGDVTPTTFSAWTITAGNTGNAFALNPATGQLSVATAAALDFETNPTFNLAVTVSDGTNTSAPRTVVVNLTNVNEAPTVTAATFSLAENSAAATVVGTVVASDTDAGQTRSFAITAGNTAGAFAINATSGAVTVANAAAIDFETNPVFTLTVTATDNGSPPLAGSATVTVNLADRNDTPVFNDGSFAIAENSANGTVVGTLAVSDQDAGQTLAIAITGGNTNGAFAVDQATRRLVVANVAALDFETNPMFTLAMSATDNGSPPASDTATVVVNLSDANDRPTITAGATLAYTEGDGARVLDTGIVVADVDSTTLVGATVRITSGFATGEDVLAATPPAGITASYAAATGVLTLSGSATLATWQSVLRGVTYTNTSDAPANGPRTISWQVDDGGAVANLSNTATSSVTVTGVNDAPVLTVPTGITGNEDQPIVLAGVQVADIDARNNTLRLTANATGGRYTATAAAGVTVSGNNTAQLVLEGNQNALNALLAGGLAYTPPQNLNGSVTLSLTLDDLGNAQRLAEPKSGRPKAQDTELLVITVSAVNDAPVVSLVEPVISGLGAVNLRGVGLDDVDAGTGTMTLAFSSASGVFNVVGSAGVSASGAGTGNLVLTGNLAALRAALATERVSVLPIIPSGNISVTITADDGGNTGSGGALSGTATLGVIVFERAIPSLSPAMLALLGLLMLLGGIVAARVRAG